MTFGEFMLHMVVCMGGFLFGYILTRHSDKVENERNNKKDER